MMIRRLIDADVRAALDRQAAVCIIGPRQVGKTTLALQIAQERASVYLDLESPQDRARLQEPELFFEREAGKLIVLDEIHRTPELFQPMRGFIDRQRRKGRRTGQFLILGSAAIELLRQSGETLAGRIEYVDMAPVSALEVDPGPGQQERLWLRGGFPDSLLARSDKDSFLLRRSLIRTYLEREVPQFGPRVPAQALERLWTMLGHLQGQLLNASRLAAALEVSSPTVARYIDLFADLLLVRRLPPLVANVGKRLVKSPKVYIRDSGLLHALLGLRSAQELLGHPVVGSSWEGFVLESLLACASDDAAAAFYRTAAGAEVDLVLDLGGRLGRWVIEIKRTAAPSVSKGLRHAIDDLQPDRVFIVHGGTHEFPLGAGVEAIGLRALCERLRAVR
jgi:predicted AAA+ superfamily ATPase